MPFTRSAALYTVPNLTLGLTNAEGSSDGIRADASIAIYTTDNPTTAAASDSPNPGDAATASRSNHVHGMPASFTTFGTPSITLSTSSATGSGDSIATGASITAFDVSNPASLSFGGSSSTGSAAVASRRDHSHGMPDNPMPSGSMAFFIGTCPSGWSEYTSARGRYIVGVPSGGTDEATVGTALSDEEDRAVGQHTHTVTDPGHQHDKGATNAANPGASYAAAGSNNNNGTLSGDSDTTGISLANAGSVASTNAPYIQLTMCKKD